jgi:hypothetical protein
MLAGKVPRKVMEFFRTNLLLDLPKSAEDIRPIGIGTMLRKVSAQFIDRFAKKHFNRKHFKNFQYGSKKGGMEQIIHQVNTLRSRFPRWDIFSMDAENAFNRANRFIGLTEMLVHCPKAFSFMNEIYFFQSNQFFFKG